MFLKRKAVYLFFSLLIYPGFNLLMASVASAADGYVGIEIVPMSVLIANDAPNVSEATVETFTNTPVIDQTTTVTTTSFNRLMLDEETYSPATIRARIGLTILPDFYPAISLESHLGFDASDDTQDVRYTGDLTVNTRVTDDNNNNSEISNDTVTTTDNITSRSQTIQLDTYAGFYIRGDFAITKDSSAYVNVGYASAQLAGDFGKYGLPNDDTASSPSYAIGATYALPWWGLTAFFDYTQLIDTDHFKISGFGLGLSAELE